MTDWTIRAEHEADAGRISRLLEEAFDGPSEARLVERLRRDGEIVLGLVAERRGEVAGHILFSRLSVVYPARTVACAALAPLAVRTGDRGQGIGAALVRRGLSVCRGIGLAAIVVLGEPGFYGRFGFASETARGLVAPFSGPELMALELMPGVLAAAGGRVVYASAFGLGA